MENDSSSNSLGAVLVTGGAGYIGSHCVVSLLEAGYEVIALDNFANSVNSATGESAALKRVEQITGRSVRFYQCDLLDETRVDEVFAENPQIGAVIHFAAIKAVGESMLVPLTYYKNNLIGMINLLEVMKRRKVFKLVFSSSCTVYGEPESLPITESCQTGKNITNVYGRTKFFIEEMLKDICVADREWNIIALRYFNPVGAHQSGLIGEDPTKAFTNIMPFISQVALRAAANKDGGDNEGEDETSALTIFGDDYDTPDGTGVRDYIHVMDLAQGHVAALERLAKTQRGVRFYNLGTGRGVSVLELLRTFERVNDVRVPYRVKARRVGDISSMYADPSLAEAELGWRATRSVEEMCRDFWRWQTKNPNGYRTPVTNGHH